MTPKQSDRPRSDYPSFQDDSAAIRARHRRDARLIQRILDDPHQATVTRGRKAYVIHWAGGRARCAVRSKAALKAWFQQAGTWAELVSVEHKDAGDLRIRNVKDL